MRDSNGPAGPGTLAIVLLQLGGPETLDDIQPFLEDMFRDPDLIGLPAPRRLRNFLARKLAAWRAAQARPLYASIGGGSPIVRHTVRQADLLQRRLGKSLPCRVVVGMRYGRPPVDSAVRAVQASGCDRVLLLPLFPQYSVATTGSSLKEWYRCCAARGLDVPTDQVESYPALPAFVSAVSQRITEALERFPPGCSPHLVFSAHGLPAKLVRQGDPYQEQIEKTVRAVLADCSWRDSHTLCYQSRLGPQRWLEPSLTDTLQQIGRAGRAAALVVPISFVSDHLETLSEINIEARHLARQWGVTRFEVTQGLNDSPMFIEALAELALTSARRPAGG